MIDIQKAIAAAAKTGKVSFGADSTIQNAKTGRAKMILLASNCPEETRKTIEYYSKLSEIPFITYRGSTIDLGAACGKPFAVSALTIREPGDSDILRLVEKPESEESGGAE